MAIKNREDLKESADATIYSNNSRAITATAHNALVKELVDSNLNIISDLATAEEIYSGNVNDKYISPYVLRETGKIGDHTYSATSVSLEDFTFINSSPIEMITSGLGVRFFTLGSLYSGHIIKLRGVWKVITQTSVTNMKFAITSGVPIDFMSITKEVFLNYTYVVEYHGVVSGLTGNRLRHTAVLETFNSSGVSISRELLVDNSSIITPVGDEGLVMSLFLTRQESGTGTVIKLFNHDLYSI